MIVGKQSIRFDNNVYIKAGAGVVGSKEKQGPLGCCFDVVSDDDMFGMNTWEEAESRLQSLAFETLLTKAGHMPDMIRYIYAGDLLGQLIATSFGLRAYDIPLFGLYGACSTIGESLSLAAMCIDAGYAKDVVALASSHFASAEKQFRFPLGYGNQRPLSSTWTVTGAGAYIISNNSEDRLGCYKEYGYDIIVKGITTGKIVDYGVKDSMNMGACMAPAAAELITANYSDFEIKDDYYDMIITGDLGDIGRTILLDLLREKGINISDIYTDCGLQIYDCKKQNTMSGGSGCGCSAVVLEAYVLKRMRSGEIKRVLFVPTGALLSQVSFNEGRSVPGIAHGVILEAVKKKDKERMIKKE